MKKTAEICSNNLYTALELYNLELIEKYKDCTKDHSFSDKHNKRIIHKGQQQTKWYYYYINTAGKTAAVIIIASLMMLTTTVFSVKALREPVIDFIIETYENFTSLIFGKDEEATEYEFEELVVKQINYIPENFVLEREDLREDYYRVEYVNNTNEEEYYFYYKQEFNIQNEIKIDSEGDDSEIINVNGIDMLYIQNQNNFNKILWNDEIYVYVIEGNIDKDILISIVDSIE